MLTTPIQGPDFSGLWERDAQRSDDPQEKMQAAMEQMREGRGGFPGGGPSRGGPPPGGGPPPSGMGRRGGAREGGGPPYFGKVVDKLTIEVMKGGVPR